MVTPVHGVHSIYGRGGDIRTLRPGDVINVPAGVPNQFLVQAG
jgi:uncharacterized RmlC-like cupin family protein